LNYSPLNRLVCQYLGNSVFQIVTHGFPNSPTAGTDICWHLCSLSSPYRFSITRSRACPAAATSI